jgi:ankyrin repeat protein
MEAAYRGNARVVQALLEARADVDVQESNGGESALMWAIQQRHPDVATLLIQAGAKVNLRSKHGMTALMFAAQQKDPRSTALLLEAGADPNAVAPEEGWSALVIAAALGNAEAAHVLLANKADPNIVDNLGYTALIYAARQSPATALVEDLLDHGADPNARIAKDAPNLETRSGINFYGATALAMAAHTNNYGIIEALIKHGADPELATERGTTPLMLAAECAYQQNLARPAEERATALKTIKLLVAHSAKVSAVGQFNVTALHCAAMHGLNEVIRFVVSKGASLDLEDAAGQTPLSIAEGIVTKRAMGPRKGQNWFPRFERKDTAKLLLELGATPLEKSGVEIAMKREG